MNHFIQGSTFINHLISPFKIPPLGLQQDKLYYSYNYQEIHASIIQSSHTIFNTEVLVQQWNWCLQLQLKLKQDWQFTDIYLLTMEHLKVQYVAGSENTHVLRQL